MSCSSYPTAGRYGPIPSGVELVQVELEGILEIGPSAHTGPFLTCQLSIHLTVPIGLLAGLIIDAYLQDFHITYILIKAIKIHLIKSGLLLREFQLGIV